MSALPAAGLPRDPDQALHLGPERADRRLVLLHGWGADATDLLDLGSELVDPDVSLVALQAPGLHPGGSGRQWYGLAPAPDWTALPAAREDLRSRLARLAESVPRERTVLLGFSQGGAMAVDVATSAADGGEAPLAALICCSGYPHPDWSPRAAGLPVLLTHGLQDSVVPWEACEALEQGLLAAGALVRRHLFAGGHGIDPALLPRMRTFLQEVWEEAGRG